MSMHRSVRKMSPTSLVALSTSAKQALGHTNRREYAVVQNLDAAIVITVSVDPAMAKGTTLAAGEIYVHEGNGPLYAKSASGTPNLGVTEFIDGGIVVRSENEGAVTLSAASATLVLPHDARRISAVFENDDAAIKITLGFDSSVTAGNGIVLSASQSTPPLVGQFPIYAIAASGTPSLGYSITKR